MGRKMRQASGAAQALESHWSLAGLVKENWTWIAPMIGFSGTSGVLAWIKQSAVDAPWYDKALVAIFATLGAAALIVILRAGWGLIRRNQREEGAVARGLSISGYTYERGAFIDGGTHSLPEVFGNDQVRTDLTFRNCQIKGPGLAAFIGCHVDRSDFVALPGQCVIDPRYSGELTRFVYRFVRCKFENCAFNDLALIAHLPIEGPDMYRFKLTRMTDGED